MKYPTNPPRDNQKIKATVKEAILKMLTMSSGTRLYLIPEGEPKYKGMLITTREINAAAGAAAALYEVPQDFMNKLKTYLYSLFLHQ